MDIDWNRIGQEIMENIVTLAIDLIVIIFIFVLANLILKALTRFTTKTIERAKGYDDPGRSKEVITAMTLLRSAGRYAIYFIAICLIINRLPPTSGASVVHTCERTADGMRSSSVPCVQSFRAIPPDSCPSPLPSIAQIVVGDAGVPLSSGRIITGRSSQ